MRTFKNIAAQGDVLIRRVDALPAHCLKVESTEPELIITHSETGHHHVMDAKKVDIYCDAANPLLAWIKVNRPTSLLHKRSFDTHEPIKFEKGVYEIRRQREYVAQGFRKAQD